MCGKPDRTVYNSVVPAKQMGYEGVLECLFVFVLIVFIAFIVFYCKVLMSYRSSFQLAGPAYDKHFDQRTSTQPPHLLLLL